MNMKTASAFGFLLVSFCINCVFGINVEEEKNRVNEFVTAEKTAVATTLRSFRLSRAYRRGHDMDGEEDEEEEEEEDDENDEMKGSEVMGKSEDWGGYYDFLINEGSYKFWAVFQLATAALLIYSGFAALYYAKVNPSTTDDYEDYFLRRRRRSRGLDTRNLSLFGIDSQTFQRIMEALDKTNYETI